MKKILLLYLLLCIILIEVAYGATLHGTLYDLSLNKARDVIVEINSTPNQRLVSKDGFYAFTINPGTYEITAKYVEHNLTLLSTEKKITIEKEGSFVLDLFLFPLLDDSDLEDIPDVDTIFEEKESKGISSSTTFLVVLAIIVVIILILYYFRKNKRNEVVTEKIKETVKEEKVTTKTDLNEILKIIKEEGGRTTQKEIRKRVPLSEAKISLMISELEHQGLVERIKKGRGNIIVLKK